jgi:hypothetical protein
MLHLETVSMTKRKPPGTSFDSWIDQQIKKAQREGQFDNLPGAGKPLPDLDEVYDPGWWVKKLVRRERISVLPPALAIKREVERGLEKIRNLRSEKQVRQQLERLNAKIAKVNASTTSGPPTSTSLLEIEATVQRWREGSL